MQEQELKEPKQYFIGEKKKKYSNPVKKKTIFLATLIARQMKNILTTSKITVVAILYYLSSHWEMAIIAMQHRQRNYKHRNVKRKRRNENQD